MALTPQEIEYLTRPDKIRVSHLSEEAKAFRYKYLKGVYKENRLMREHAKRKADIEGVELIDYTFVDWKSEEEYHSWIAEDRTIRKKILDEVLADDDWLETLAKKYYGDNWMVVYADKENNDNWRRKELPDKRKYKRNVKED